ncbi:MAG: hypothetical protein K0S27_622 [Gammaproteobacteria bacterium]|jgi:hypothetical protein|nr:hypothetical protein [Gammaproteobacteria bacterium]
MAPAWKRSQPSKTQKLIKGEIKVQPRKLTFNVYFIAPREYDLDDFEKFDLNNLDGLNDLDHSQLIEGALYFTINKCHNQFYFTMCWPKEYVERGLNQENIGNWEWINFPDLEFVHLARFEENLRLFSIDRVSEECKQEIDACIEAMEQHINITVQTIERQRLIRDLFTKEEEKNIKEFFGARILNDIKKLRTVLFNGWWVDGTEQFNFNGVDDGNFVKFAALIAQLKKLPDTSLNPADAEKRSNLKAIAAAAEALQSGLQFNPNDEDDQREIQNKLAVRILGAILATAPGALAGFKAGAALGAIAGGGVASAPTALIGGGLGALVGGVLGFFAGNKIAVCTSGPYAKRRYAEARYSSQVAATVRKIAVVPAASENSLTEKSFREGSKTSTSFSPSAANCP